MSAKTIRLLPLVALVLTGITPIGAGAAEPPQKPVQIQAASCVADMFPNKNLLPADFCQRSSAERLRILQELADETEIAAPAAQKQIEVFAAKQKTGAPVAAPSPPQGAPPPGATPDVKQDQQRPAPVVSAAPSSLPIIQRVHNRDGILVAEAFIPGVGYRTLRKDSSLPENWRVFTISTDQVVITNNSDPKTQIPLPSSTPLPQQRQTTPISLPSLDAELPRQAAPAGTVTQ